MGAVGGFMEREAHAKAIARLTEERDGLAAELGRTLFERDCAQARVSELEASISRWAAEMRQRIAAVSRA
jgi:hypothetical protein